ncbi:MAG: hypothetical protein O3A00_11910 [Planctomycetota bacterium]|nr:hypothetical protein [Planctomycetota bacterium]
MPTHIAELIAYKVRIPLKKKIQHASHTRTWTDSVVVRCRLSSGVEGWGEGLPREYVTGETIDDVFPLLNESAVKSQLAGPVDSISETIGLCDRFQLARPDTDRRECFGNSLRCAIEMSVLDAVCRTHNVPLAEITRQDPCAFAVRGDSDRVRYSAAITSMKPWKQRLNAWLIWLHGFHQTKVKVGTAGISDVDSLARIRKIIGSKSTFASTLTKLGIATICRRRSSRCVPLQSVRSNNRWHTKPLLGLRNCAAESGLT